MKTAIILLSFLVVACGREDAPEIDPGLAPFVENYLRVAPDIGHFYEIESIKFGENFDSGEHGVCLIENETVAGVVTSSKRKIIIRKDWPYSAPQALTVYHELAHCIHDAKHTGGEFEIMNPERRGGADFWDEAHVTEALEKLFYN